MIISVVAREPYKNLAPLMFILFTSKSYKNDKDVDRMLEWADFLNFLTKFIAVGFICRTSIYQNNWAHYEDKWANCTEGLIEIWNQAPQKPSFVGGLMRGCSIMFLLLCVLCEFELISFCHVIFETLLVYL